MNQGQQQQVEKLRSELVMLEGRQQEQQQIVAEANPADDMKSIFDRILADAAKERERRAAEDRTKKLCPECYLNQPISNMLCELCSARPASWLLPSEMNRDSNSEQRMFMHMTAEYSISQLRTALRSGWASIPERKRFARKLLALREDAIQHPGTVTENPPEPEPEHFDPKRFDVLFERELAKLEEERRQETTT